MLHCDDKISESVLADILLSIQHLKHFASEANDPRQGQRPRPVQIDFLSVCSALHLHEDSLEEHLVANSNGAFRVNGILVYLKLNDFTNLKRLAMSPLHKFYYKLHERLPPQLETLQIQYAMDDEKIDDFLESRIAVLISLVQNKDLYVPQLMHFI